MVTYYPSEETLNYSSLFSHLLINKKKWRKESDGKVKAMMKAKMAKRWYKINLMKINLSKTMYHIIKHIIIIRSYPKEDSQRSISIICFKIEVAN